MINLSLAEMLSLWSDLDDAMFGVNSFGGNVAELYIYRFGYSLSAPHPIKSYKAEEIRAANESLYEFLNYFAKKREVAIAVEERDLGEWVKSAGFEHRVRVTVGRPKWLT